MLCDVKYAMRQVREACAQVAEAEFTGSDRGRLAIAEDCLDRALDALGRLEEEAVEAMELVEVDSEPLACTELEHPGTPCRCDCCTVQRETTGALVE